MTKTTLKGGSFNLRYGRDQKTVKDEITRLLNKHDLDFLALQEAVDYKEILNDIKGYRYFFDNSQWAGKESTVLVKEGLYVDSNKLITYGDGWYREGGGGERGPVTGMTQVRIDKWLLVRSLHLPTPTYWNNSGIDYSRTPHDRADDLIAGMKKLRNYFIRPSLSAKLAVGDWNEIPDTVGMYGPVWLKTQTGSKIAAPKSKVGHGIIDWVMYKNCKVTNIFKDLEFNENSDHEPVLFTVTGKSTREGFMTVVEDAKAKLTRKK